MTDLSVSSVPAWVPQSAGRYLAHTEAGKSIRDLARRGGCHASTVLRQIRRIEARRDDPLVDAALKALGAAHFGASGPRKSTDRATSRAGLADPPDDEMLERQAVRVLRRLCETGAVLAVARDMDKTVVMRGGATGAATRTAVVEAPIAQAMALNNWISCATPGRVSRYQITAAGRAALARMLAVGENRARDVSENGFAEAQTPFADRHRVWGEKPVAKAGRPSRVRYNMAESPLTALARRRDRDGKPFLSDDLVRAGERLREDFELAQMGTRVTQDWDRFLTGPAKGSATGAGPLGGPQGARDRVAAALADLGPGLSDVVLRCCCYLEGLEIAEKRMGWSARSGKIVLRIALHRLRRHYDDPSVAAHQMVG